MLNKAGASVLPAETHYLLLEVGNGAEFRKKLMAQGCLVRDCASFGLPQYIRVGTRLSDENQRLLEAWAKVD
jgi:histidinol-phosphate/aromatic aminotransferase/cobyric acid decarboxylase-like protein